MQAIKLMLKKKEEVEKMSNDLKDLIKTSEDENVIKTKTDELSAKLQEIGAAIHQKGQQTPPAGEETKGENPNKDQGQGGDNKKPEEGEVVEGEVEDPDNNG